MKGRQQQVEAAFHAAETCLSRADQERYLAELGARDPELRTEVEALVRAAAAAESLFPTSDYATDERDLDEPSGAHVGRYRLVQKIGEGGMGVVYLAEQLEPVRRQVALKVIKLGMDTRQFVARFEAERQALALMDHPNIAKVLDAGATSTGRPYFVMELIQGLRITDYC